MLQLFLRILSHPGSHIAAKSIAEVKISLFFPLLCQFPVRSLIQIHRETQICVINIINGSEMNGIAVRQELPVNAFSAQDINILWIKLL